MIGVASSSRRKSRTMVNTCRTFTPAANARLPEAWTIGPSAIGSVKGMPISIRSAPAPGIPRSSAAEVAASGSQASTNGMKAPRPSCFSAVKSSGDAAHGKILPLPQTASRKGRGRTLMPSLRRDHSFTPRCSATVKMSLSPRPHRFIRMMSSRAIVGASFVTWASACAGSSAGMMPSVRVQS